MPCEYRMRRKFEIVREEIKQLQKENSGGLPFDKRDEKQKALEDLYVSTRKKLDEHEKELARLKERLRKATSELERAQLEKEIAELEVELERFKDVLEQMEDFVRDLARRTISLPAEKEE